MRPENIKAWAEGVEFGHPPPSQPPFDQFGTTLPNTSKTEPSNQYDEADLNRVRKQNAEIAALVRAARQKKSLLLNSEAKDVKSAQKTGPSNYDREAHMNHISKRDAEREALARITRQQKILFPNAGAKDVKPEPGPYRIPRKPVAKSNDTTPRPPQVVLMRNGEIKRLGKISSYAERVRDLGYPEALCPLPITEAAAGNTCGVDCTGAKVVKEKDNGQNCQENHNLNTTAYSDGNYTPQNPFLTPNTSPSSGEALVLRPAQAANSNSVSKATAILKEIDKPPTAPGISTDHHIESEMRRLTV